MAEVLRLPAPAKLNLFLHIIGRRPDGYHDLETVFQLLDWGDTVQLALNPVGSIERSRDIPGVDEESDLTLRAARLLQDETGCSLGANISVEKRIPMGSGLGGASSDAATVLHGLNRLWKCGLDTAQLARLGLQLGADVPVFVHGASAWACGVGDKLRPLPLGRRHYVLVFPEMGLSTAALFADPELKRDHESLGSEIFSAETDFSRLENNFEPVVLKQYPELQVLREALSKFGPVRMTGTGSTFFLTLNDKNDAKRVTTELKSIYNARAVAGVDRSILLDRMDQV